jgi:hypothetical protein
MRTLHLISGLPCSGKTAYAIGPRAGTNGVLFSLDHWLITSFGKYAIVHVGHEEHTRRVLASRELIWHSASELLRRSVDVISGDIDGFGEGSGRSSHRTSGHAGRRWRRFRQSRAKGGNRRRAHPGACSSRGTNGPIADARVVLRPAEGGPRRR